MPPDSTSRWTVMVFMGADTVAGETTLIDEAHADIKEMERAMAGLKPDTSASAEPVNVFVQAHFPDRVIRQHIGKSDPKTIDVKPEDATNGKALIEFLRESLNAAGHKDSDYSMLVLWGHAYQFAIARARVGAGEDSIDFAELARVLRDFQKERQAKYSTPQPPRLGVIGFDACELASIEMAVQLHPFTRYLLASQIDIPLPGWPYDRILQRLREPQGKRVAGHAEFGSYVVRRYCETFDQPVTLTMLDLRWTPEIFGHTEVLALRLAEAISRDREERRRVLSLFAQAQTADARPFVDVADLCLSLARNCRDPFVVDAAGRLGDLLVTPAPEDSVPGGSAGGARCPFVVEHGRNRGAAARLHGVSLYAPQLVDNRRWETATYWYNKFVFAQDTVWSKLVHALALQP